MITNKLIDNSKSYPYVDRNGVKSNMILVKSRYVSNDALAIIALCSDFEGGGYYDNYAVVSVNLPYDEPSGENCIFVDTNTLGSKWVQWMEEMGLGSTTGRIGKSGYCSYPEFKLDDAAMESFEDEGAYEDEEPEYTEPTRPEDETHEFERMPRYSY